MTTQQHGSFLSLALTHSSPFSLFLCPSTLFFSTSLFTFSTSLSCYAYLSALSCFSLSFSPPSLSVSLPSRLFQAQRLNVCPWACRPSALAVCTTFHAIGILLQTSKCAHDTLCSSSLCHSNEVLQQQANMPRPNHESRITNHDSWYCPSRVALFFSHH